LNCWTVDPLLLIPTTRSSARSHRSQWVFLVRNLSSLRMRQIFSPLFGHQGRILSNPYFSCSVLLLEKCFSSLNDLGLPRDTTGRRVLGPMRSFTTPPFFSTLFPGELDLPSLPPYTRGGLMFLHLRQRYADLCRSFLRSRGIPS